MIASSLVVGGRRAYFMNILLLCAALILSACGGAATSENASSAQQRSTEDTTPATATALIAAVQPAVTVEPASVASSASSVDPTDWDAVLAAARGQTVNWYLWGGSEGINRFVDTFYGEALQERYGITLNRVPIADTVDAVNQVLSEKEAGKDPGVVDMIWINGENFSSLKQATMLYGGWARALPNARYVDWENSALNLDFGIPIDDMESPWSSAQFQFIYDTARVEEQQLPRSFADLKTWACAHPGRFTYIAPGAGAFQGTRFVKAALFELSGGAKQWSSVDEKLWQRWSPKLWTYLNELKPCLWREGVTYPKDENELHSLFANREVDFSITQAIAGAQPLIDQKLVPETSKAFVFDTNMIGDFNYVAIPSNAPHKAAALVLADLILDPELQAAQVVPANGFGLGFGIDVTRVSDTVAAARLKAAAQQLGPGAADPQALAAALVGDAAAPYQNLVEQDWKINVLQIAP